MAIDRIGSNPFAKTTWPPPGAAVSATQPVSRNVQGALQNPVFGAAHQPVQSVKPIGFGGKSFLPGLDHVKSAKPHEINYGSHRRQGNYATPARVDYLGERQTGNLQFLA
ncbi:MAG: hypothetical protein VKJ06_06650 [Vampirovibrionales bacterium]|nr:hypothetical protein [Vampirovibrionales bacterium]